MGNDTVVHITIGLIAAAGAGIFTAGGFYIYVQLTLKHIEEQAQENHRILNEKIDKNFVTLESKSVDGYNRNSEKINDTRKLLEERIKENHVETLADLSGIGGKVAKNERDAARRYHNISVALMLAVESKKEKLVSKLMKEEAV